MNRMVAMLSQWLEPADRECVCGDVEELRLPASAAAVNILGLVIRRQWAEWASWGPWVALLGVAGLAGSYLSGSVGEVQSAIFVQIRAYLHYGVAYEPGGVSVEQQIAYTATLTLAILLWSWACGFVLASLSRRALWITAFLFYCLVRDSRAVHLILAGNVVLKHGLGVTLLLRLLPLEPVTVAFLFALALGVRSARKGALKRNTRLLVTAAGLTLVFLLAWMQSWYVAGFAHWSGQPYVPLPLVSRVWPWLAGAWPVFSVPFLPDRQEGPGPHARLV